MKFIGFTRKNTAIDLPEEDSFGIEEHSGSLFVCTADGITRDPIGLKHFPERDAKGIAEFSSHYLRPSPAKDASQECVSKILEHLRVIQAEEGRIGRDGIFNSFSYANQHLLSFNNWRIGPITDYLENDWLACVASAGVILDHILYYGYIGDCGVLVINEGGDLVKRTPNEVEKTSNYLKSLRNGSLFNDPWRDPMWRANVRREYRNRTDNPYAYGAFTGEPGALKFVHTGKAHLGLGYYVLFYSDGMEKILFSNDSIGKHLAQYGLERLEEICEEVAQSVGCKAEGTLVAVAVE